MTVELNYSEVCILLRGATAEWQRWEESATKGTVHGWHDNQERERVLSYQQLTWELVKKLTKAKEEISPA